MPCLHKLKKITPLSCSEAVKFYFLVKDLDSSLSKLKKNTLIEFLVFKNMM